MSGPPDYPRREPRAQQLDRNWAELIQELRVLGTGIQVLFSFLLSIAFQARFGETTDFQKDVYLGTLLASGLAVGLLMAPVALHRFLFQFRMKDRLVTLTNRLVIGGLIALSVAMVGSVLLVGNWVGGTAFGWVAAAWVGIVLGVGWFAAPAALRHRVRTGSSFGEPREDDFDEAVSDRVDHERPAERVVPGSPNGRS